MLSIPEALAQIKSRFADSLPEVLIQRLAQEVGHRGRDRDLGPVVTTYLFLQQILHGNIAIAELRRLTGSDFTAPRCGCGCQEPFRVSGGRVERFADGGIGIGEGIGKGGGERGKGGKVTVYASALAEAS